MHHAKLVRYGFASFLLVATLASGSQLAVHAQEKPKVTAGPKLPAKGSGRDPFGPFQPPRVVVIRRSTNLVSAPALQQRIEQYRAQKLAAMNAHLVAPKPTTALLLGEIQVVGITRTPRGYAAIVEATPIKLSYVVYPGERFYDGQLVAIEDSRLIFRHETIFTDGKRELSVETKPLRQPSAVEAMTATKAPSTPASDQKEEKKSDEKPSTPDQP